MTRPSNTVSLLLVSRYEAQPRTLEVALQGFDAPYLLLLGGIHHPNLAECPEVVKLAKFAVRQQNRIKKNQQVFLKKPLSSLYYVMLCILVISSAIILRKVGNKMMLMNVMKVTVQVISGVMYYLTIEVTDAKVDKPKTCQAKVFDRVGGNWELLLFRGAPH